jgi:hypothetical protein
MTITQGNEFQIDASGFFANVVKLTSTTAICFYSTAGSDIVAARHLTLSGNNITAGTKLVVDNTVLATFGKNIRSVRLTNTSVLIAYSFNGNAHKARIVTVSGTTLTAYAAINLTDTANIRSNSLDFLTSTAVIYVYGDSGGTGKARILTVSGTTVTENAAFTFDANCFNNVVAALSTTKAVVAFADASNSNALTGEVLDISGTTITGNADQTLSATTADVNIDFRIGIAALDSTHVIVQWFKTVVGNNILAVTASEAGGALSAGATITSKSGLANQNNMIVAISASRALGVAGSTVIEYSISGITTTTEEAVALGSAAVTDDSWVALLGNVSSIAVWDSSIESIPVFVSPAADLTLSIIPKPASIDASGTFIYLALLQDGTPILSKFSTALDADGETVFDPGAGDTIGVECGRFDANVIWIAGLFDGTNQVEKSEDAGSTFVVKDSGFNPGGVFAFDVGPDVDTKVIVNNNDTQTLETTDDGATWAVITTENIEALSIDRLAKNTQETVFGNFGDVNNSINYSINSGADIEDFQTGVFPNENVTGVIVN